MRPPFCRFTSVRAISDVPKREKHWLFQWFDQTKNETFLAGIWFDIVKPWPKACFRMLIAFRRVIDPTVVEKNYLVSVTVKKLTLKHCNQLLINISNVFYFTRTKNLRDTLLIFISKCKAATDVILRMIDLWKGNNFFLLRASGLFKKNLYNMWTHVSSNLPEHMGCPQNCHGPNQKSDDQFWVSHLEMSYMYPTHFVRCVGINCSNCKDTWGSIFTVEKEPGPAPLFPIFNSWQVCKRGANTEPPNKTILFCKGHYRTPLTFTRIRINSLAVLYCTAQKKKQLNTKRLYFKKKKTTFLVHSISVLSSLCASLCVYECMDEKTHLQQMHQSRKQENMNEVKLALVRTDQLFLLRDGQILKILNPAFSPAIGKSEQVLNWMNDCQTIFFCDTSSSLIAFLWILVSYPQIVWGTQTWEGLSGTACTGFSFVHSAVGFPAWPGHLCTSSENSPCTDSLPILCVTYFMNLKSTICLCLLNLPYSFMSCPTNTPQPGFRSKRHSIFCSIVSGLFTHGWTVQTTVDIPRNKTRVLTAQCK